MLIELLGPMGVGKSSVAPLLAASLAIPHYVGLGATTASGHRLSRAGMAIDAIWSAGQQPGLTLEAWRTHSASAKRRLTFATAIARRSRFASSVRRSGGGVLDGGPMHALFQESSKTGRDYTTLARRVTLAHLYIYLVATEDAIAERLVGRDFVSVDEAVERARRYLAVSETLPGPVVAIDTTGSTPEQVADRAARQVWEGMAA